MRRFDVVVVGMGGIGGSAAFHIASRDAKVLALDPFPIAHAGGTMPCFAFDAPTGFFYGFPSLDDRGVKIAEHSRGDVVADPLHVNREIDDHERQRVEAINTAYLPGLGTTLTDHAVCLYTMSPDRHFVVGRHPEHERVVIAAGFSGHGFKFASVLGEAIADITLAGNTRLPIDFLSPSRFP